MSVTDVVDEGGMSPVVDPIVDPIVDPKTNQLQTELGWRNKLKKAAAEYLDAHDAFEKADERLGAASCVLGEAAEEGLEEAEVFVIPVQDDRFVNDRCVVLEPDGDGGWMFNLAQIGRWL